MSTVLPPPPGLPLPPPGLDHPSVRNSYYAPSPPAPPPPPSQYQQQQYQHSQHYQQQQQAHFVSMDVNSTYARPPYATEEELDVFAREKMEANSGGGGSGLLSRVLSRFSLSNRNKGSSSNNKGSGSSRSSFSRLGSFRFGGNRSSTAAPPAQQQQHHPQYMQRPASFHINPPPQPQQQQQMPWPPPQQGVVGGVPRRNSHTSDGDSDYGDTATVFSNYSGNTLKSSTAAAANRHVDVVARVHTKSGTHEIVRAKKTKKKSLTRPAMNVDDNASTYSSASKRNIYGGGEAVSSNPLFRSGASNASATSTNTTLRPSPLQVNSSMMVVSSPGFEPQHFRPPPPASPMAANQQHLARGGNNNPPPPLPTLPPVSSSSRLVQQYQQQPAYSNVRVVQVIHDYAPDAQSAQQGVLQLRMGEVLQVIDQTPNGGWWQGVKTTTGQRGYFAPNFVKVLQ